MSRMSTVLSSLALAAGVPMVAYADGSLFTNSELSTFAGKEVLGAGTTNTFPVGKEVTFLKAPTFPATEKVSVRIFALPEGSNIPTSWATFEPCIVYWSSLYPVRLESGVIKLFTAGSGWLNAMSNGDVKQQRYLMVFENGGGDGRTMIRIRNDSVTSYFSKGVVLVIEKERNYSVAEGKALAAERGNDSDEAMAIAKRNIPEYRCYVVMPKKTVGLPPQSEDAGAAGTVYAMNDCEPPVSMP